MITIYSASYRLECRLVLNLRKRKVECSMNETRQHTRELGRDFTRY